LGSSSVRRGFPPHLLQRKLSEQLPSETDFEMVLSTDLTHGSGPHMLISQPADHILGDL